MVHDLGMTEFDPAAPAPESIAAYITRTWPDTAVAEIPGAWFFSLDAERHFPNFATIVTDDDHDQASDLARPGVFRLNIGLGRETFERLVGAQVGGRLASGAAVDYTALDTLLPHPVYAAQRFVAILNPSAETFERLVKPLLEEAYERLARQHRLQHPGGG
jgi:hypothetical protein